MSHWGWRNFVFVKMSSTQSGRWLFVPEKAKNLKDPDEKYSQKAWFEHELRTTLCIYNYLCIYFQSSSYLFYLFASYVSIYFTVCCLFVKNDPISNRSPNTKDEYLSSLNVRRVSSPESCVSISIAKLAYPSMFLVHMCCMSRLFRPQPDRTNRDSAWS